EGDSVEVDAIEPALLREMVRDCIERHIDHDALARLREVEAKERETLLEVSQRFFADSDDEEDEEEWEDDYEDEDEVDRHNDDLLDELLSLVLTCNAENSPEPLVVTTEDVMADGGLQ